MEPALLVPNAFSLCYDSGMEKETQEFNGHTYYRYPQSSRKHLRVYFWPSRSERERYGLEALHREIWKAANGPIPEGALIHHRDGNTLNNDIANLECVDRKEHGRRHPRGSDPALAAHLARIRSKATEWHRSEAGREWHRKHGRATWEGREPVKKVCHYCHEEFETLANRSNVRYCSTRCEQRWNRAHGLHRVSGTCEICGSPFEANRYRSQRTCSRRCGAFLRERQRRQER